MLVVLFVGLIATAVVLVLAARRVHFLYRVISSGQPAPDRINGVTRRVGAAGKRQVVEVFGQKKLLKWTVPGAAHFFVFWAFLILGTVYLEAYAILIARDPEWSWFVFGNWAVLGFLQDFIAVMCLVGIGTFWWIRIVNNPKNKGRGSRFFGSHLGPAYFTLFMIFNVLWTLFLFRGAVEARDMALSAAGGGDHGYGKAAFASYGLGTVLPDSTALIGISLLLHIGVMLVFLMFVLNSKHLHIFVAPLNVMFGRSPVALGAAKPMMSDGKALTLEDLEDLDEDAKLGVGAAEDFSWKGVLDFNTCTECGRCQDQCPAWNTEKPLSPKLMIMALRDHTLAKAPYLLADEDEREALVEGDEQLAREVERPLVGDTGDDWFYMPEDGSGVIDPDVLWSCVTCGACVQQCPVDIEHVDHIVDMRRYQVLVESNFPAELNGLFKGLENKGNPWNMSSTARLDWAKDLPFEVKVVGDDIESLDEVEWLFWVGCAGAYEDRAKKTTRAVAELLNMAGVSFGVLGNGETCTGDSARRAGNEFVFQGLAAQNIETFKEYKVKKAVTTCAHCFNTLKNEYSQLGITLEVVHHTQLLNRLVREKKLTPISTPARSFNGPHLKPVTYHDPCYLGRHNQVYEAPRELLNVLPDARFVEMPRNSERSFCCGAGGARMWMEETIGTRINETRTKEAVETGAAQIATGCPFCRVMLSDGLTSAQSKGEAHEEMEVLDVAQLLLAAVKGESKKPAKKAAAASASDSGSGGTSTATIEREESSEAEETKAEPDAGDSTQTEDTVTETEDVGAAAKASGGSSLFDLGDEDEEAESPKESAAESEDKAAAEAQKSEQAEKSDDSDTGGGSLFDIGEDDDVEEATPDKDVDRSDDAADTDVEPEDEPQTDEEPEDKAEPEEKAKAPATSSGASSTPATEIPEGGSLFDLEEPEESTAAAPAPDPEPEPEPVEKGEDPAGDSTTDEDVDRSEDAADTDVEPDQDDDVDDAGSEDETPASTGTGITPASEIPEGGSLFDIAEPEESTAAAPDPEPEPDEKGEDPAGDSTTDEDVDRSEDAADTDVEPDQDEAEQDEPDQQAAESSTESGLGGKYPEGQSMFDVPDDTAATEEPRADEDSGITSLKDIKAKYSGDEPAAEQAAESSESSEEAAEDSEEATPEVDEPAEDEPKPASSGETHEPKTDKDIGEAGSLFDL